MKANNTKISRGENWGFKAAHGTKWLIRKLKTFDKRCVARTRSKGKPSWLGHIPLIAFTLAITAILAYFSLYILFALGILSIAFKVITNGSTVSDNDSYFTTERSSVMRDGPDGFGLYDSSDELTGIRIDKVSDE